MLISTFAFSWTHRAQLGIFEVLEVPQFPFCYLLASARGL